MSLISFNSNEFVSHIDDKEISKLTAEIYTTLNPSDLSNLPIAQGNVKNKIIVARNFNNQIVGAIAGGIYSDKVCLRKDNWYFGENRDRSFWIEFLFSKEKGLGTKLINKISFWFDQNKILAVKKNYYVTSVPGSYGFYLKMGYQEIKTPSHQDDIDSPEDFRNEYDCIHMAKPFTQNHGLDRETLYTEGLDDMQKRSHMLKRGIYTL